MHENHQCVVSSSHSHVPRHNMHILTSYSEANENCCINFVQDVSLWLAMHDVWKTENVTKSHSNCIATNGSALLFRRGEDL